jgi:PASTA domain
MAIPNTTGGGQPDPGTKAGTTTDKEPDSGEKMTHAAARLAQILLSVAAVVSALMGLSTGKGLTAVGVAVTAFVLFTAAGAVGTVLGFLFGLPRGRFADQIGANATDGTTGAGSGMAAALRPSAHYLANSNLIKVSDWLTTIVIGLGLVNLASAMPALQRLAAALKAPLGGADYAGAVGICLLIAGSVGGFVVMYLYTTIRIRELLEESATDLDSVPPLGKLSLGEAQQVMSTRGLKMTVDGPIGPDAVVLDQSPKPGDTVPVGTAVKVTVGASKNDGGEMVQAVPVPRPGDANPNGAGTSPALSDDAAPGTPAGGADLGS